MGHTVNLLTVRTARGNGGSILVFSSKISYRLSERKRTLVRVVYLAIYRFASYISGIWSRKNRSGTQTTTGL